MTTKNDLARAGETATASDASVPQPPPELSVSDSAEKDALRASWTPFNLNDYVRVRVVQRGFEILREQDRVYRLRPGIAPRRQHEQEQNGGWSEWQLWDLMSTFGPHISLGCDVPFETTIEFAAIAKAEGR